MTWTKLKLTFCSHNILNVFNHNFTHTCTSIYPPSTPARFTKRQRTGYMFLTIFAILLLSSRRSCCMLHFKTGFFLNNQLIFFYNSLIFFLSFNGFALLIYFIYYIYFFILFTALGFKIFVVAFFLNQDKNMILSKLNYNKLDRYFEWQLRHSNLVYAYFQNSW